MTFSKSQLIDISVRLWAGDNVTKRELGFALHACVLYLFIRPNMGALNPFQFSPDCRLIQRCKKQTFSASELFHMFQNVKLRFILIFECHIFKRCWRWMEAGVRDGAVHSFDGHIESLRRVKDYKVVASVIELPLVLCGPFLYSTSGDVRSRAFISWVQPF